MGFSLCIVDERFIHSTAMLYRSFAVLLGAFLLLEVAAGDSKDMDARYHNAREIRKSNPDGALGALKSLIEEGYQSNNPGMQSHLHRQIGNCYIRLQRAEEATPWFRSALNHAEASDNQIEEGYAHASLAFHANKVGDIELALYHFGKSLATFPEGAAPEMQLQVSMVAGKRLHDRGNFAKALATFQHGMQIAERENRPVYTLDFKLELARLQVNVGNNRGALSLLVHCWQYEQRIDRLFRVARERTKAFRNLQEHTNALTVVEESIERFGKGLAPRDLYLLEIDRAQALFGLGRIEDAVETLARVFEETRTAHPVTFAQGVTRSTPFLEKLNQRQRQRLLKAAGEPTMDRFLQHALEKDIRMSDIRRADIEKSRGGEFFRTGDLKRGIASYERAFDALKRSNRPASINGLLEAEHASETEALKESHESVITEKNRKHSAFRRYILITVAALSLAFLVALAATLRELRHRKRFQMQAAQLKEQAEALQASNADKTRLLRILCHDIRGPIQVAVSWTALLEAGRQQGNQAGMRESMARIDQAMQQLVLMAEDVTVWAQHMDTGGNLMSLSTIRLDEIVSRCHHSLKELAGLQNVRIEETLTPETVLGDDRALQVVVYNILQNALKFTPRGGVIEVNVEEPIEGYVDLCIQDSGPGLPPTVRENLLQGIPCQAPHLPNRYPKGLGVGMTMVRDLIHRMNGTLLIPECDVQGTRMVVRLPSATPPTELEGVLGPGSRIEKDTFLS